MVEEILKDKYKIIKEIGSGTFGKVYVAEDLKTKSKVAIKRIKSKELEENDYLLNSFWKELEVMSKCECENSVRLIENFNGNNFYNIVMELCDTDLEIVLNKRPTGFPEEEVKIILQQLNKVFAIMEKENIIHRDLKLRNILVIYQKNAGPPGLVAKLSDFGFSKVMDDDITRTKLGTPATMAPEILMNKTYTKKADIWSIGVITYQLLFKTLPFRARNEKELMNNIINSKGIKIPDGYKVSQNMTHFLKSCLTVNPKDRLSWKQYFDHPLFQNSPSTVITTKLKFEERYQPLGTFTTTDYSITQAKDTLTGDTVLIKELPRKNIDDNILHCKIFTKEIELMNKLKGDCFVKFIDLHVTSTHYYIITEYLNGLMLHDFLTEKKSLSESFAGKIIKKIANGIKEINENQIVLEFISTKSFWFNNFKDEENFQIKFYDYGLLKIFTDELSQREFTLTETACTEKTNVLSMGMVIYKLIFGESIYKFSKTEDPALTVTKRKIFLIIILEKSIKLSKKISKEARKMIEKCCNNNQEKRYDWKSFLMDPFVNYVENINSDVVGNVISGSQIENLSENFLVKAETIVQYYTRLFNEDALELDGYKKHFKEMSIFTMLVLLEVKLFKEFLRPKEKFFEDEEIHLLKIHVKGSYDYGYINFLKSNIAIARDMFNVSTYMERFSKLELDMIEIVRTIMTKIDLNMDEIQSYDYLAASIKNYYSANIEHYFFKIFENGITHYSNSDFKAALNEFVISKYFYESIIFIRLISSSKEETLPFFELLDCIEHADEINLFSKNTQNNDMDNLILVTFLGGVIKSFKANQKLEEEISSESLIANSNEAFESLIRFYPEIIKLVIECSKTI